MIIKGDRRGKLSALLVLGMLASPVGAQGIFGGKPAATVDGVPISMADVDVLVRQAGPRATALTESQRRQMQWEAVGMLIDDVLMQQFLRKYGPKIEQRDIEKKIAELRDGLKKSGKTMADFCKESGQTEAQLRSNVLNMLQWMGYVQQHVTDADVKRFYDQSKDFFDGVTVRASHIVLRVTPTASEAEKQAVRGKLLAIRQDIALGKISFADAAKKHSECMSAPSGGDIGFFPRKMAVDENFAKTAFGMRINEMSDVVQTEFGFHLIVVTERKQGTPSDFNKIKEQVREICVEELRQALLAQQRRTAKVEINLQTP